MSFTLHASRFMLRFGILCSALCIPQSAIGLPLYRDSLPNGLIVLTYEDQRLPIASVSLLCRSGAAEDPKDKTGTAAMAAELLARGTATMTGDSVTSITEYLGARFNGRGASDYLSVEVQSLSKDLEVMLDLLSDAVLHPAFSADELELTRSRFLSDARRMRDYPSAEVSHEFDHLLFGDRPYGRLARGDTLSIPRITRADLVSFHETHFRPNNCFIVAVGVIERKAIVAELQKRFGEWQPAQVPTSSVPELTWPEGMKVKLITRPDMNQTYVELGQPGITATDTDMLSTRLMSYILGGSPLSSRLGMTVREHGGLAYDVRCWFDRNRLQGAFHATVQTANPREAIAKMLTEIKLMHDSGATQVELEKAHNYYTGVFPLTYSSTNGKKSQVMTQELNGYGMDWLKEFPDKIRDIALDDINRSARERLRPGNYVMVILGPVTKDDLGLTDVEWIE